MQEMDGTGTIYESTVTGPGTVITLDATGRALAENVSLEKKTHIKCPSRRNKIVERETVEERSINEKQALGTRID